MGSKKNNTPDLFSLFVRPKTIIGTLKLNGQHIAWSRNIKYLEVILD